MIEQCDHQNMLYVAVKNHKKNKKQMGYWVE